MSKVYTSRLSLPRTGQHRLVIRESRISDPGYLVLLLHDYVEIVYVGSQGDEAGWLYGALLGTRANGLSSDQTLGWFPVCCVFDSHVQRSIQDVRSRSALFLISTFSPVASLLLGQSSKRMQQYYNAVDVEAAQALAYASPEQQRGVRRHMWHMLECKARQQPGEVLDAFYASFIMHWSSSPGDARHFFGDLVFAFVVHLDLLLACKLMLRRMRPSPCACHCGTAQNFKGRLRWYVQAHPMSESCVKLLPCWLLDPAFVIPRDCFQYCFEQAPQFPLKTLLCLSAAGIDCGIDRVDLNDKLRTAAGAGDLNSCVGLITLRGDVNASSYSGGSAVDVAVAWGAFRCATELIVSYGGVPQYFSRALQYALDWEDFNFVTLLVQRRWVDAASTLHEAARRGAPALCEQLLRMKADTRQWALGAPRRSPLDAALAEGHSGTALVLLSHRISSLEFKDVTTESRLLQHIQETFAATHSSAEVVRESRPQLPMLAIHDSHDSTVISEPSVHGWEEVLHRGSGRTFYRHLQSGWMQWEKPTTDLVEFGQIGG